MILEFNIICVEKYGIRLIYSCYIFAKLNHIEEEG